VGEEEGREGSRRATRDCGDESRKAFFHEWLLWERRCCSLQGDLWRRERERDSLFFLFLLFSKKR
jgi:hypothetical protein